MSLLLLAFSASHAAEEPVLLPFGVRLLGATIGIGAPCVIREPPPHGAWTVIYEVVSPGETGLTPGGQICEIVHSPSMHLQGAAVGEMLGCQALAVGPPLRFACDGTVPTAGMLVSTLPEQDGEPADEGPDPRLRRGRRR